MLFYYEKKHILKSTENLYLKYRNELISEIASAKLQCIETNFKVENFKFIDRDYRIEHSILNIIFYVEVKHNFKNIFKEFGLIKKNDIKYVYKTEKLDNKNDQLFPISLVTALIETLNDESFMNNYFGIDISTIKEVRS